MGRTIRLDCETCGEETDFHLEEVIGPGPRSTQKYFCLKHDSFNDEGIDPRDLED